MELLLSPRRALRNRKAATLFMQWSTRNGSRRTCSNARVVQAIVEFILCWWHEGESKEVISDLLQGLNCILPHAKLDLSLPWRLYRKWSAKELPWQAPPAARLAALSIAGLAFKEGRALLGTILLAAFDGYLRTGEFLSVTPEQLTASEQCVVWELRDQGSAAPRGK